jgi:hypothetical protein
VVDKAEPASPPNEKVPNFFIVGHQKSGTTALYDMLRQHPQVYLPERKEPWFFAKELHEHTPPRPGGTPKTLEEYLLWFKDAQPGQHIGDATPHYLWSRVAAKGIAEVQPNARIIAILREPASFLRSLHMQYVQTYIEPENDFRRALSLEKDRREGGYKSQYTYWPQMLQYAEYVQYVAQLKRFYEVFPANQILVLIYDDFKADNQTVTREVMRFIGVDDTFPVPVLTANPTVRVRSQNLNNLIHAISVGRGPVSLTIKEAIKSVTPRQLRRRALFVAKDRILFSESSPLDESLVLELRKRFKEEVVALGDYLGRDLVTLWGYDNVG